jgi:hypothetical protein
MHKLSLDIGPKNLLRNKRKYNLPDEIVITGLSKIAEMI